MKSENEKYFDYFQSKVLKQQQKLIENERQPI